MAPVLTCDAWRVVLRWLSIVDAKRAASTCRLVSLAARREVLQRAVASRDRFSMELDDRVERTRDRVDANDWYWHTTYRIADFPRVRHIIASWLATAIECGNARRWLNVSVIWCFNVTVSASSRRHMRGRTVVHATVRSHASLDKTSVHRWSNESTALRGLNDLFDQQFAYWGVNTTAAATLNVRYYGDGVDDRFQLRAVASHLAHMRRLVLADANRLARDVTLDDYRAQLNTALAECASLCRHYDELMTVR